MRKRKLLLLGFLTLLLILWLRLFYKTWDNTAVPDNADCIVTVDTKKIAGTLIWEFITTPSAWWSGNIFSLTTDSTADFTDMVKLPDYIFAFHVDGEAPEAWYCLFEMGDADDFAKGIAGFKFQQKEEALFVSTKLQLGFLKQGNKLLFINPAITTKDQAQKVMDNLLLRKAYMPRELLINNINARSHVSVFCNSRALASKQPTVVKINFDKNKLSVSGKFAIPSSAAFTEANFKYANSSLMAAGFTASASVLYDLLQPASKDRVDKILNFSADSLFHSGGTYQLELPGLVHRVDTAVKFTYDDNFNAVADTAVQTVNEPSFRFTVTGSNTDALFNYWNKNNLLQTTDAGILFTPVPFVKSFVKNNALQKNLIVESGNYQSPAVNDSVKAVVFIHLQISKTAEAFKKYWPPAMQNLLTNIGSVTLKAQPQNNLLDVQCFFYKRNIEKPLFAW